MNWSEVFAGDTSAVVRGIQRVRGARRELDNVIRRISVDKEDVDVPLTPAARWARQERLRGAYEQACKLVAVAEVELLRAVLEAAKIDRESTRRSPGEIVSVG